MYNLRYYSTLQSDIQFTIHDLSHVSRFKISRYLIDLDSKPNLPKTQEQYTNPISVLNNNSNRRSNSS